MIRFTGLLWMLGSLAFSTPSSTAEAIIWNVGQGQWVTWVENDDCLHFDMGGERAPWRKIRETCANKRNIVYFSHWDWDHISFTRQAARELPRFCIAELPAGPSSPKARKHLGDLPTCDTHFAGQDHDVLELTRQTPSVRPTRNDASRVFEIAHFVLAPGDSTVKQERIWRRSLVQAPCIRHLILGHHGSRTSTSNQLLDSLPRLRQAVASARFARYGHPHRPVVAKLVARGVALLKTEEWGSIIIKIKSRSAALSATRTPASCLADRTPRALTTTTLRR